MKEEIVCEAFSEHTFLTKDGRFVRLKKELPDFAAAVEESMKGRKS